jgi:hypothetical protein
VEEEAGPRNLEADIFIDSTSRTTDSSGGGGPEGVSHLRQLLIGLVQIEVVEYIRNPTATRVTIQTSRFRPFVPGTGDCSKHRGLVS